MRFKIYNPKYDELIIEELNSDFIEDDDDDDWFLFKMFCWLNNI